MSATLTPEQAAIHDTARDLLRAACTPAGIRAAWESDTGRDGDRWARIAEVGLTGLLVPEAHDGLGLTDLEMALVLEHAGRVGLPEPLLETAGLAAPTIAEVGTDEQRARWLRAIAAGEAFATVQLPGQPLVSDAHVADVLVTVDDGRIHIAPRDRFDATPQRTFDGARRLARVTADLDSSTRTDGTAADIERLVDRAAVASSAVLVGIASHLLDETVHYVTERHQFGRPIGSFQAIKHKLAESLLVVATARQAVRGAARELAARAPRASVTASVTKSYVSDAAKKVNYEALQCHGGIGFTWESDLHLWLKRGKALEQAYGTAAWHRQRIAQRLFERDTEVLDAN